MRKLTAREAGQYTARLDRIAEEIESNWKELGLTQKQALEFAFEIDKVSEEIVRESKAASVIQGDADEPYMKEHFDSAGVVDGGDGDEPYMKLFGDGPGRPSHENRNTVSDRTEAKVEGLSEYSDGFKKQPSQPSIGGSPFPGKSASVGDRRYTPQTPAGAKISR
jgi:hypothetical protein